MIPQYINLDHRTDRRKCIENEFQKMNIDIYKRFSAIHNSENGAIGCSMSHIKVLESSTEDYTWVCEDDIEFKVDKETLNAIIKEFVESDADILCLGYASRNDKPYSSLLRRSYDLQTTSSYIVKKKFQKILHDFWKSVLESQLTNTEHSSKTIFNSLNVCKGDYYSIDMSWKVLQQSFKFVIPYQRCIIQRESYSDITKSYENYGC